MSIKDFLKGENSKQLNSSQEGLVKLKAQTSTQLSELLVDRIDFDNENIKEKTLELIDLSFTDTFLNKIDEQIGKPKENETKEEYVERGLSFIKKLLEQRFN